MHYGLEDGLVKIGTPRGTLDGEARMAMTPDSAKQLKKLGYECLVETRAGAEAGFSDAIYREAYGDAKNSLNTLLPLVD